MPTPEFLPGETLSAGKLQQLAQLGLYQPFLLADTTNPNLGTGPTRTGYYWVNGQHVTVWAFITFGSSPTAGSGRYLMSLPPDYPVIAGWADWSVGVCRLLDSSASSEVIGHTMLDVAATTGAVWFEVQGVGTISNSNPWTWAAGDVIFMQADYLTDPY